MKHRAVTTRYQIVRRPVSESEANPHVLWSTDDPGQALQLWFEYTMGLPTEQDPRIVAVDIV